MNRIVMFSLFLCVAARGAEPARIGDRDFMPTPARPVGFRGDGTGWFPGAKGVVTGFDGRTGSNVVWTTKLPNAGQASPIVFGGKLLTCADPDQLFCLDADTGKILWSASAGLTAPAKWSGGHVVDHTWTMPTPVSDGVHVIAKFLLGALLCTDLEGKVLWRADIPATSYEITSPLLADGTVVIHVPRTGLETEGELASNRVSRRETDEVRGYDVRDGTLRWTATNSMMNGGSTPAVVQVDGQKLIVTGRGALHRASDGKELFPPRPWKEYLLGKRIEEYLGHAGEHSSVLASGEHVYLYRTGHTRNDPKITLVRLAGTPEGKIGFTKEWETRYVNRVHGTSVETDTEVFASSYSGDIVAIDRKTGKGRFTNVFAGSDSLWHPYPDIGLPKFDGKGGLIEKNKTMFEPEIWSGPVVADGHAFLFTQKGGMVCVRLQPKLEVVGSGLFDADIRRTMRASAFCASPFFSGTRMYVRTPTAVVCIAPPARQP